MAAESASGIQSVVEWGRVAINLCCGVISIEIIEDEDGTVGF
jgi:hypothetical protein